MLFRTFWAAQLEVGPHAQELEEKAIKIQAVQRGKKDRKSSSIFSIHLWAVPSIYSAQFTDQPHIFVFD